MYVLTLLAEQIVWYSVSHTRSKSAESPTYVSVAKCAGRVERCCPDVRVAPLWLRRVRDARVLIFCSFLSIRWGRNYTKGAQRPTFWPFLVYFRTNVGQRRPKTALEQLMEKESCGGLQGNITEGLEKKKKSSAGDGLGPSLMLCSGGHGVVSQSGWPLLCGTSAFQAAILHQRDKSVTMLKCFC